MKYFVSRQCYWPDGEKTVELSIGGLDFSSADMYSPKYTKFGEGNEFNNPIEAAEATINVLNAWKKDAPEDNIYMSYGNSLGMGLPFESCTVQELMSWAERAYEKLPKCDECGELLGKETYRHDMSDDDKYCSSNCAENNYYTHVALNAEQEEQDSYEQPEK